MFLGGFDIFPSVVISGQLRLVAFESNVILGKHYGTNVPHLPKPHLVLTGCQVVEVHAGKLCW